MPDDTNFVVFILTHGRPEGQATYKTLKRQGYSGPLYFVVDDEDKTLDEYKRKFGDKVIVFDKKAVSKTFDNGDNFDDRRAIIYARNACFGIAEKLGFEYFIEFDDDYTVLQFRFDDELKYVPKSIKNVNDVLNSLVDFYVKAKRIDSLAFAQGGDFIGGKDSPNATNGPTLKRKCMNSFICSTKRGFQFVGRVNEDVNTYTCEASKGLLMLTATHITLVQKQTQSNKGGMTEMYLDNGTYVKSFYSVMYQPSSVVVSVMNSEHSRLHHKVDWGATVPMILSENHKKY